MNYTELPPVIIELLAVHEGLSRMGFHDADNIMVDVDEPRPRVILKVEDKACVLTVDLSLDMDRGKFEAQWYQATAYFNEIWLDSTRDEIWKRSATRRNLESILKAISKAGIKVPLLEEVRREELGY